MTSLRGLVVDFGGVLTTPLQEAMGAFAAAIGIELQDLVRVALSAYTGHDDALIMGFERGTISEEDFVTELAARLSAETGTTIDPEGLVARMFGGIALEEDMFAAVEVAKRAGFATALCSNSWGEQLYPRDRLNEVFDAVVISGDVGFRKPDPAIFELTLEQLGLEAQECVFVDDFPGHLEAAAALGMTTVLHHDPAGTISELEELLGVPLRGTSSDSW